MISLFRKIRRKLLSQNRITRYISYALGEIFIVVIGNNSPVRDLIWVEKRIYQSQPVPLGTGYNF